MKKDYIEARVDIILFDTNDVIVTSAEPVFGSVGIAFEQREFKEE